MKNVLLKWVAAVALLMALTSQGFATPVMYLPWQNGKAFPCTQGNNSPFSHNRQLAYAYDLGLPEGEPVLASAGGIVSSHHDGTPGFKDLSFGNFVIINHGDGTYALYAHMQNGSVSQFVHNDGQTVQRGDQIGRCGATGMAYGAHLHIQVMRSSVTSSQTVFFSFAEAGSPTSGQRLTSGNSPPPPPAVQQGWSSPEPLYRYNGPFHFYTASFGELGYGNYGYRLEMVQCHVFSLQGDGMTPLYRYGSRRGLGHFYTTSWNELGWGNSDWAFEQIQCYVFTSGLCWKSWGDTIPLYRYANLVDGDRFYTTNYNELGGGNWMWRYEGIQCWVLP